MYIVHFKQMINQEKDNQEVREYNQEVKEYNQEVREYNQEVKEYKGKGGYSA